MHGVDLDMLAEYLQSKIDNGDYSLRGAAGEIGCSPATLSRLLEGSSNSAIPDTANLIKAASWLERNLSNFEFNKRPEQTTMEEVEVHLRALKGVSEQTVATMIASVRALYELDKYGSSGPSS